MRIQELLEGGWDTKVTQGTVIKPATVKITLAKVQQFVSDFNRWLSAMNQGPVELGRPTGSGTYHELDAREQPDKIYGDIDLQMIAPDVEGATQGQYTAHWNRLADEFVKSTHPDYIHAGESKPGHPIFQIGPDQYVQVDFMWHPPHLRAWGAARVTPERGVKGLLTGNMFSVLGELLDMSIQHAGVQLKTVDDVHVPFSKHKDTVVKTISVDPESFIYDIFMNEYEQITGRDPGTAKLDPLLNRFRGNGLYLLDEPEAALSPKRQLAVITRIHDLVLEKSQFIIATHSPILMAYPDALIYQFSAAGIERIAYEETEHYRITRDFLANPQRMLKILFER